MGIKKKSAEYTIIGSGESGEASLRLLVSKKIPVRCSTNSKISPKFKSFLKKNKVAFEEEGHTSNFLKEATQMVISPGISPTSYPIRLAKKEKIPVISEVELASIYSKGPLIAITGTNGKTTTTTLIHHIIKQSKKCDLCGNIGKSFSRSLIERPGPITRVLELSSFQLKYIKTLTPHIAVILNLSPNHLDWHSSLNDYYGSKLNIYKNMNRSNILVINATDSKLMEMSKKAKARKIYFGKKIAPNSVWIKDDNVCFSTKGSDLVLFKINAKSFRSEHLKSNLMAAVAVIIACGLDPKSMKNKIKGFKLPKHRQDFLGQINGIEFINDSKSTTSESTLAAVKEFEGSTLIVGGIAKQRSYKSASKRISKYVSKVVFYGKSGKWMKQQFDALPNSKKIYCSDFKKAVQEAYSKTSKGGKILLSPMCSSFDQFSSYKERGECFKDIFETLKSKT